MATIKSIEEKAKAYDGNYKVYTELINRLEDVKEAIKKQNYGIAMDILFKPYPEFQVTTHSKLAESEDEEVRKEIVTYLKSVIANKGYRDIIIESWIAWLEKQNTPTEDELEALRIAAYEPTKNWSEKLQSLYEKLIHYEQGEQKPADKVEPKFRAGDWVVVNDGRIGRISECTKDFADVDFEFSRLSTRVNNIRFWTIQDANDGDVLSDGATIFMFKDLLSDGSVISHCDYDTDTGESDAFCPSSVNLICSKITPATKEQRDTLMKAMTDAGYTFDFERKELKKIEQKPAWSEEDEVKINRIVACLENLNVADNDILLKDVDWLKSLKNRYTWKPSEGQLECLGYAIEKAEKDWSPLTNNRVYLTLKALKEQLLELRGSKV